MVIMLSVPELRSSAASAERRERFSVPADLPDPMIGDPDADDLRAAWLRAGLQRERRPAFAGY